MESFPPHGSTDPRLPRLDRTTHGFTITRQHYLFFQSGTNSLIGQLEFSGPPRMMSQIFHHGKFSSSWIYRSPFTAARSDHARLHNNAPTLSFFPIWYEFSHRACGISRKTLENFPVGASKESFPPHGSTDPRLPRHDRITHGFTKTRQHYDAGQKMPI